MLDQVLLRGSLVKHFERVDIINDDRLVSPVARTPTSAVSDHLPIELTLNASIFEDEG